ncbi:hypothetical protein NicSoilC12_22800 [Arthrobacter sp. NicSoilC12]|nr:hypothetical protein NicSoilC12_22800 [Arthrobacter sp. NicSoilC12]
MAGLLSSAVAETVPATGRRRPASVSARVDFPVPFCPVMVSASPAQTRTETPDWTGRGAMVRKPSRSPARRGRSRDTASASAESRVCPAPRAGVRIRVAGT